MNFLEIFPEEKYKRMLAEIGPYRYQIFEKNETLPAEFVRALPIRNYNWVLVGTSSTISAYAFSHENLDIIIPAGEQLIVTRLLRYDDGQGKPHYNADDYLIFPTQAGHIFRLKRAHALDHFIEITNIAAMKTLAEAYRLPKEKSGLVQNYSENGASLHITLIEKPASNYVSRTPSDGKR